MKSNVKLTLRILIRSCNVPWPYEAYYLHPIAWPVACPFNLLITNSICLRAIEISLDLLANRLFLTITFLRKCLNHNRSMIPISGSRWGKLGRWNPAGKTCIAGFKKLIGQSGQNYWYDPMFSCLA